MARRRRYPINPYWLPTLAQGPQPPRDFTGYDVQAPAEAQRPAPSFSALARQAPRDYTGQAYGVRPVGVGSQTFYRPGDEPAPAAGLPSGYHPEAVGLEPPPGAGLDEPGQADPYLWPTDPNWPEGAPYWATAGVVPPTQAGQAVAGPGAGPEEGMTLQPPPLKIERYGLAPWYADFQREHGTTPEEYYKEWGTEPYQLYRYSEDTRLRQALRDKDWSEGFEDMYNKPPGEYDWQAWYYQSNPLPWTKERRAEFRAKRARWAHKGRKRARIAAGDEPGDPQDRKWWFGTFRSARPMSWKHFKNLSAQAQQTLIDAAPDATQPDWGYDSLRIPKSADVPEGYQRPPTARYKPIYWRT